MMWVRTGILTSVNCIVIQGSPSSHITDKNSNTVVTLRFRDSDMSIGLQICPTCIVWVWPWHGRSNNCQCSQLLPGCLQLTSLLTIVKQQVYVTFTVTVITIVIIFNKQQWQGFVCFHLRLGIARPWLNKTFPSSTIDWICCQYSPSRHLRPWQCPWEHSPFSKKLDPH